jgi:hypothetical protein
VSCGVCQQTVTVTRLRSAVETTICCIPAVAPSRPVAESVTALTPVFNWKLFSEVMMLASEVRSTLIQILEMMSLA